MIYEASGTHGPFLLALPSSGGARDAHHQPPGTPRRVARRRIRVSGIVSAMSRLATAGASSSRSAALTGPIKFWPRSITAGRARIFTLNGCTATARARANWSSASLDPLNEQSKLSPALLAVCRHIILQDRAYIDRLRRHYQMFKRAQGAPASGPSSGAPGGESS